jgi:hypothetical protein
MLRNRYHAKVRDDLTRRLRREAKVSLDHILKLISWLFHCLIDDDPVHGAAEVKINFLENSGCVDSTAIFIILTTLHFFFEITGRQGHGDNAVLLLRVELWKL